MKAVVVYQHGDRNVLTLSNIPIPEPNDDEVLVKNQFVSVNFVDTQKRSLMQYTRANYILM